MKAGVVVSVLLALSWGAPAWADDKPETCDCTTQSFTGHDCKGTAEKGNLKTAAGDCVSMLGKGNTGDEVFNGQFRDGCTLIHFFTMSKTVCDKLEKDSNSTGACCPGSGVEEGVTVVTSNTESNCTNLELGTGPSAIKMSVKIDCPQGGTRLVVILSVVGAVMLLIGVVAILSFACKSKKPDNYVPVPAAPQDDLLKDKGEGGNQYGSVGL